MELNRETAMRLWNKSFGKETKVADFAGRIIAKGAYNDRKSEFGWNVDHILPQSRGGTTADHNLVCCHISTNDEKADKFPCFKANGITFEIVKVQNHYEIRLKSSNKAKPKKKDDKTDFYDSASGIRLINLLSKHQDEERFAGTVFVKLQGVTDTAIYDFIQLLMETEDFSCEVQGQSFYLLNNFQYKQNAEIVIKSDFLPRKDDIAALLDKSILLNTYLKHFFLPVGDISGYDIHYRVDSFESSHKMFEQFGKANSPNRFYGGAENSLHINKLVWLNTEAKENTQWSSYSEYITYDYYFTNLAKNLDKEASGR